MQPVQICAASGLCVDVVHVLLESLLRHPDFFDAFWASNRGSVSKASPILNLSEDIFAGFNVLMRN